VPYADLSEDKQHIIVRLDSPYREKDLMQMIPGAKWKPDWADKPWAIPTSWAACKVLRGVFGDYLAIGDSLAQWSWAEFKSRVEPCMGLRMLTELDVPELDEYVSRSGRRPFPFQKPGALFLATAGQALLADEMGAGKSMQTILAWKILHTLGMNPFPALVICPNSVKPTWKREIEDWYPGLTVNVISGSAAARRKQLTSKAHVYVINWEAVMLHSRLAPYGSVALKRCVAHGGADPKVTDSRCEVHPKELNGINFKTVVADEAHKLKSPKVKQTRAVWAVGHQPSVDFRIALTGTPIANDPGDLWSVMHFLSPAEYPTRTKFVDRFGLLSWNTFGGMDIIGIRPETKDEFYSIIDPRMRRMPKALVLSHLPPKVPITREAEMGNQQAKAYEQMATSMIAELEGGLLLSTNPLTQMLRLVQFSSAYAHVDETVNEDGIITDTKTRLAEPSNKIDELMELIDELEPGYPLVIAAPSRQLIMLAQARLEKARISTRLIVGGLSPDQRQAGMDDFMAGRAQVILGTHGAMKEGLTLTRADMLVRLQRSWSLLDELQVVDRVHRIGSEIHESIKIVDIVTPYTVEWKQLAILREKEQRLQEVVRDRETLIAGMRQAIEAKDFVKAGEIQRRVQEMDATIQTQSEVNFRDPGFVMSLLRGDTA
jgi:SNF2 family DNA or RNA helicase